MNMIRLSIDRSICRIGCTRSSYMIFGRRDSSNVKDESTSASKSFKSLQTSGAWMIGGMTASMLLPPSIGSSISIFLFAYLSSRAAQPLVNTKLSVQRLPSDAVKKTIPAFLLRELSLFKEKFLEITSNQNAHRGGNIYALRGAFAKMLTFTGFDVMYSLLSPVLLPAQIPILVIIPLSGLLSGLVQGSLIALPEYLSTLQSRYPDKSNTELYPLMWAGLKDMRGLPIITVALRNGLFDMIFNTMRVGFCVPFGPSAVIAMTMNYPIERFRSLVHQNEWRKGNVETIKRNTQDSQIQGLQHFQGWFSKAAEFFAIYQLLQLFKELPQWIT